MAQADYMVTLNRLLEDFTLQDLYFTPKKPEVLSDGSIGHKATSVRDISVGDWQMRALATELVAPVTDKLDVILHSSNVGWVPGRIINQPVVRANRRITQARSECVRIFCLLLDFLKAFPTVDLPSLWYVMETIGWEPRILTLLILLHSDMRQVIQMGNHSTKGPDRTRGLWTGSGASTVLLLILLDVLIRYVYNSVYFGTEDPRKGSIDAFADDFTVIVLHLLHMRFFGDCLQSFSSWSGVYASKSLSLIHI